MTEKIARASENTVASTYWYTRINVSTNEGTSRNGSTYFYGYTLIIIRLIIYHFEIVIANIGGI